MTSHLVGLIGSGVGPSLSPPLHQREADFHGLRYLYRLIDIADLGLDAEAAGDLVRAARQLGYTGLNITHPCKQTVIKHLDELSPDAAMLGAVNTVVFDGDRAIGHNTDWTGFARSFARGLPGASTRRVVQLGAGGAGAAVAHALLTLGADRSLSVDVQPESGDLPGHRAGHRFGAGRAVAATPGELAGLLSEADGLVNVTPIGMAAASRAAAARRPAATPRCGSPRSVYRPAGDGTAAPRAGARLPDPGRRRHGRLPGRPRLPPVHGLRARHRTDAHPPDRPRRRLRGRTDMRKSIATVSLSGTLAEKLTAIAGAGFDGVEIFENDLLASPLSPEEVACERRISA